MTPTHANKKGVRYRYYVSHALLQGQAGEAGSIVSISAPDAEARAPANLTVTRLVRNLPTVWAEQGKQLGLA
jgi:hypothetical protein